MKNEYPLVTIIVITYNSSKYVLETLESAKAQTYQNIELIISDDCSTDNTVEICSDWLIENKNRFVRTELITIDKNTGISPNVNRGFNAAKGEWVKPIAGDDTLIPESISSFIHYSSKHPDTYFFFSDMEIFGTGEHSEKREGVKRWINQALESFSEGSDLNLKAKKLKYRNLVSSPSAIYQVKAFKTLGGFDEEIKLLEDHPFWLNALKNGYKILSIKKKLVRYRVNEVSVQTSPAFKLAKELFLQKYIFKNIFFPFIILSINQLKTGPKDNLLCNILKLTSLPQRFIYKIKKKLLK